MHGLRGWGRFRVQVHLNILSFMEIWQPTHYDILVIICTLHTHTHNNRKLFVLADDDIFLFSFSFTTISFSPTTQKKKTELRKGVLILLFLFYVMILFTHKHFGWQHQNNCFFFGLVFLLFQTCPSIQKRKWSMKKEWKTMKCFTKKCFLSYRMAADNFN